MTDRKFVPVNRRKALGIAAMATGAAAMPGLAAAQSETPMGSSVPGVPSFVTKIDFMDPIWNRDTYARIDGELDFRKQKVGRITGLVHGVRENEAVRPLMKVDGFMVTRTMALPDGNWRRLVKEVLFYRDLITGEIMEQWYNPYTDEYVPTVPVANDPFNYDIRDTRPRGPSFGGLNDSEANEEPYLLDWSSPDGEHLIVQTGINLFYPAAMRPADWPRESSGEWNRVSEHFIWYVKKSDVENPAVTGVPNMHTWSRITPWLPWMRMGQAQGHCSYLCHHTTIPAGIAGLPDDLVAAAVSLDPGYLEAPREDYGPSLSSLENYRLTQSPSPVPPGWAPPMPPAPPPHPAG